MREVGKNWPWGSHKEGGGQGEVGTVRRKVGLQVRLLLLAVLKTFDPYVRSRKEGGGQGEGGDVRLFSK